jgi:membrane associated rhomboid family serine protease
MSSLVSTEEVQSRPGGSRLDFPILQEFSRCPVTGAVFAICIVNCLLLNFVKNAPGLAIRNLLVPDVLAIWSGSVWGLLTSAFVHIAFWHILFNLWWARDFGRLLEPDMGSRRYAGFILAAAVTSSGWQILVSITPGIGFSGVVYALFGYALARRRSHPAYQALLRWSTIGWLLAWLVLCLVLTILNVWTSIANGAHFGGLAFGYLVGLGIERPRVRRVARAGLVMLLVGVVLSCVYMPWSETWRYRHFFAQIATWHRQAEAGELEGQYRYGAVLARWPRTRQEGLEWLRKAAQGGNVPAMNDLAWCLATAPEDTIRNGSEAVHWAMKAYQLNPGSYAADTLAATYAEADRWVDAIAFQEQATRTLPAGDPHTREFADRLERYRQHQKWREPH